MYLHQLFVIPLHSSLLHVQVNPSQVLRKKSIPHQEHHQKTNRDSIMHHHNKKHKPSINNVPPNINNQKPKAFKNGNDTSRAPICNGMTAFIKPNNIGIAAKKIIVVPCIVIISL